MVASYATTPRLWRVVLGLIIAPGTAAFCVAAITPAYYGLDSYLDRVWQTAFLFWLVGGVPPAIIIGLPAYLLLRHRVRPTAINCSIVGAVAASLPWIILVSLSAPDNAFSGGGQTVIDGRWTLHGWIENAKSIGAIALAGGLGGLAFWAIATGGRESGVPTE